MDQLSAHHSALRPSQKDNIHSNSGDLDKMSGDAWEHIRNLDETENWHERNVIISRSDHQAYTDWAREVVDDMVDSVPRQSSVEDSDEPPAPKAPPTQTTSDDDFQYMNEFRDEDFQGSAAQFDVEYLESLGNTNPSHVSALTRESLYVKFDPLVGGGQSLLNSTHKSTNSHQPVRTPNSQSNDLMAVDTPPRVTPIQPHDLLLSSPSQLKTPETSLSQTPHSKPAHPPSALSTTTSLPSSTSPSAGRGGDRQPGGTGTLVEVLKYGEEDMAAMVEQTRQEERGKYEAQVQLLKEEVSRKEVAAQRRVDRVQRECQAIRNEMKNHISEKQKLEEELEQLKELQKTSESEHEVLHTHYYDLRDKVKDIEQQREAATRDFEGLDKSFADLHQRYLRLKQSSDSQQQNEKDLRSQIARLEDAYRQSEDRCRQLQADATQQMNKFNTDYDAQKKQHAQDVALTKATVKKLELQVESLKRALEEKVREKEGLTQLCDELLAQINPVP